VLLEENSERSTKASRQCADHRLQSQVGCAVASSAFVARRMRVRTPQTKTTEIFK